MTKKTSCKPLPLLKNFRHLIPEDHTTEQIGLNTTCIVNCPPSWMAFNPCFAPHSKELTFPFWNPLFVFDCLHPHTVMPCIQAFQNQWRYSGQLTSVTWSSAMVLKYKQGPYHNKLLPRYLSLSNNVEYIIQLCTKHHECGPIINIFIQRDIYI